MKKARTDTEEITQEMMKNARTSGTYEDIWSTRGKCVFCDLKDKYILLEENGIVLTISLYPYIDGHLMAIPRRHVKSPKELSVVEWETMRKFNYIAKKLTRKVYGHKGMWTLVKEGGDAQSTVADHLHMHFIPFDSKDLCTWNYRELKHTPLENVAIYKENVAKIQDYNEKYEHKYKSNRLLKLVCDILLVNEKQEVLFQERTPEAKFIPDYWSIPGGGVDYPERGVLPELQRELIEEIGYEIDLEQVHLLDSQIDQGYYANESKYLGVELPLNAQFVRNSYYLLNFTGADKLTPGDDCAELIWLSIPDALASERVSPQIKTLLQKLQREVL